MSAIPSCVTKDETFLITRSIFIIHPPDNEVVKRIIGAVGDEIEAKSLQALWQRGAGSCNNVFQPRIFADKRRLIGVFGKVNDEGGAFSEL